MNYCDYLSLVHCLRPGSLGLTNMVNSTPRPTTVIPPERVLARHHGSLWLLGYIVSSGNKNITVQFDDISDQRLVHKSEVGRETQFRIKSLILIWKDIQESSTILNPLLQQPSLGILLFLNFLIPNRV